MASPSRNPRVAPEIRFSGAYSEDDASGCWNWRKALDRDGYGAFTVDNKSVKAHRFAYEHLVGPIPDGLTIDHLCRNKACVNPEHMEPVTARENLIRRHALNPPGRRPKTRYSTLARDEMGRLTHCKAGHEFTPENTRMQGSSRTCRECANRRKRESYERKAGRPVRDKGLTHCPHGHEYTERNTKLQRGTRVCRTCCADRQRAYYAKTKEVTG